MTSIFHPSKLRRRRYIEKTAIFGLSILHQKKYVETTWIFRKSKLRWKVTSKYLLVFAHWYYVEQSTSKRRDFFPIEITSKKYVEATCKYVDIFFLTYRRNIDMESMLITRVVLVGFAEMFVRLMCFVGTNEKVQHEKIATWKSFT